MGNVYQHYGHEFAAQQRTDPTCHAFINQAFPTQGRTLPGEPSPPADPDELAAMITRKAKYYIIRTARAGSWALLTYGSGRRVYVPVRCRQALLQSAHAAMMAGMGATCHLLKKAFYWPSLDEDARRYTRACKAQRRLRTRRGRRCPPQGAGDGAAGPVNEPDRESTRAPHLPSGPATTKRRAGRRPQALRGVNPALMV